MNAFNENGGQRGQIRKKITCLRPVRHSLIPGHVEGLRQAAVEVKIVSDHAPGTMALPVEHIIADLINHMYRYDWEFLKHGHSCCQAA